MTKGQKLSEYLEGKPITSDEEYEECLEFIEYFEQKIEGGWKDPDKQKYVKAHTQLAELMLNYETKTDDLPF